MEVEVSVLESDKAEGGVSEEKSSEREKSSKKVLQITLDKSSQGMRPLCRKYEKMSTEAPSNSSKLTSCKCYIWSALSEISLVHTAQGNLRKQEGGGMKDREKVEEEVGIGHERRAWPIEKVAHRTHRPKCSWA